MLYYNMIEEFRVIEGIEQYSVSNFGNVKNNKTHIILKTRDNGDGYLILDLRCNGYRLSKKVHHLVAYTFIENPNNHPCIDHIDNCRKNNNVNNLRWATKSQNSINKQMQSNNTSGCRGVSLDKRSNTWRAYITINRRRINIGSFNTLEDAKEARIKKANEVFGEFVHSSERLPS